MEFVNKISGPRKVFSKQTQNTWQAGHLRNAKIYVQLNGGSFFEKNQTLTFHGRIFWYKKVGDFFAFHIISGKNYENAVNFQTKHDNFQKKTSFSRRTFNGEYKTLNAFFPTACFKISMCTAWASAEVFPGRAM